MIFIAVRFTTLPGRGDEWPALVEEFTRATRAEPGNLFFEWSRSVDDPDRFVLLEAFAGPEAGAAHVATAHFAVAMEALAGAIATTPEIINVEVPGRGWSAMAELTPRPRA